ncbi:MAG: site-specific integrase [Oscillospiraceae bacterium]|nr:site-specific integrase [Oscillospiraceae bacterium]
MASWRKKTRTDGSNFYEIKVSRGRGKPAVYKRWDIPKGWSEKSIERELSRVAAEFERQVKAGEAVTLREKKEAEELAAAEAKKIKTVTQYINGVFMPTKEITLSENGRYSYRQFCDKYIIPEIGNMLIVDVTPANITKLLLDFQKNDHAHATCVKLYNILNGVFQMAFLDDSIPLNPMLKVKRPAPRKREKVQDESDKAYTVDELKQIINYSWQEYQDALKKVTAAKENEDSEPDTIAYWEKMCLTAFRWFVYLNLSIDTGARRGELCGLQWQDVNWDNPGIMIKRNAQYDSTKGIYVTTPKNGKTRSVDIGDHTLTLLKQLRARQAEVHLSKWVFPTEEKKTEAPGCMNPQSATQYFKRFGDRHGLQNFHPHILRHSSASVAITNGADVTSVSARLGHSDTAVTLRMYAHANEESIRRAGQTVRDALNNQQVKQA